jgi:NOL1/NOP2/fmu family ribosome biogenesis protein
MNAESGLRIMRNGLLLGELKKNRFEPSQALAMVLTMHEYDKIINLPVSDERVVRYLKGETIEVEDFANQTQEGWNLLCVDGYPLGWGKFNGSSLKNKYLAGWRWM